MQYQSRLFLLIAAYVTSLCAQEYHIVVVIPSYNNAKYYQQNLASVIAQNYKNYHVVYVDDCSQDKTADFVQTFIEEHNLQDKIYLVRNPIRCLAGRNIQYAIHNFCKDSDIVAILDGDDYFPHENVLARINMEYQKGNIWRTTGNFKKSSNGEIGKKVHFDDVIIKKNLFRRIKWHYPPLRTYYAWLYKEIKLQDLLYQGAFFRAAQDVAKTYPIMEMAGSNFSFIPDVLYVYNCTVINNSVIYPGLQVAMDKILKQRKPYTRLLRPTNPSENLENPFSCAAILSGVEFSQIQDICQMITQRYPYIQDFFVIEQLQKIARYNNESRSIEYLNNIKSLDFLIKFIQTKFKYEFCLLCDESFLNKYPTFDIPKCIRILRRTKALCMSFVQMRPTEKQQDFRYTTYLEDTLFTFQFGWKPQLSYQYKCLAHIFVNNELVGVPKDISLLSNDMQLLYGHKNKEVNEKAGLLYCINLKQ